MHLIIEFLIKLVNNLYHHKRINIFIKRLNIKNIIDVGAHKGEFFESVIQNNVKIKSGLLVEPQNTVIKNLNNLKINFPNIKIDIENVALSSKIEKKQLYINSLSSTTTLSQVNRNSKWLKFKKILLSNDNKKSIKKNYILSDTLDNLMRRYKINKLDFLKIDTEGYEYEVLNGATNSLKNHKIRYIMLEKQLSRMYLNYSFEKIEKLLHKNDFVHIKTFRFPLALFEDKIYKLKKK